MRSNLPLSAGQSLLPTLSGREVQLLQFAAKGHTDQSIANHLGISLATVGTYWGRVRIKLGPFNRTELVAKFLKSQAEITVNLLREENQALVKELEEHTQTEHMLRASLELFRGLLETAPDAIIIVDDGGYVQFANERSSELFGYQIDELVSLSVELLVPERYRGTHIEHRDHYNQNPVKRQMGAHLATMALRKDGSEFPMATALSAANTPRGLLITCIIRDLTAPLPKSLGS